MSATVLGSLGFGARVAHAEDEALPTHSPHVQLGPVGGKVSVGKWRGRPSFRWGASFGYRYRPGMGTLAIISGLDVSHDVIGNLSSRAGIEGPAIDRSGHEISAVPTFRIGGGRRVFGYGLFGAGLAFHDSQVSDSLRDLGRERDVGFAVQVGGGLQVTLPARLAVGAEVSCALHSYPADGDFADDFVAGFENIADYLSAPQVRGGVVLSWGW